jgi:hypothetical protein
MAVCRIIDTGATPDQYGQVRSKLGFSESNPPPGAHIHIAAQREDGTVRIVEVWDSREEAEAFGEKVRAARQELNLGDATPSITYYEVIVAGTRPIEAVGTAPA